VAPVDWVSTSLTQLFTHELSILPLMKPEMHELTKIPMFSHVLPHPQNRDVREKVEEKMVNLTTTSVQLLSNRQSDASFHALVLLFQML